MLDTFRKLSPKKQARILDAATHVFAQRGFYRATVAEICKRARISNGALYKYFKNKDHLFLSILEQVEENFRTTLGRYVGEDRPVFDILYDILGEVIRFAERNPDYIVVYQDLGSPSMKKFSDALSERIEASSRDAWTQLAEAGQRRGEIDRRLESRMAAYAIDNHVMLFMFSCVSPHYSRRIDSYFAAPRGSLSREEKRRIIIESLRRLLS